VTPPPSTRYLAEVSAIGHLAFVLAKSGPAPKAKPSRSRRRRRRRKGGAQTQQQQQSQNGAEPAPAEQPASEPPADVAAA